jgi:tetratricopeptide (TPR) repeat protein
VQTRQTTRAIAIIWVWLAYRGMKDLSKAKVCFQRALEMSPKSDQAETIRKSLAKVSG